MSKYKIELHAHSDETSRCGSIKAEEVVKKYYKAGYNALVMTDHYYARFFDKIADLSWNKQLEKYLKGYKTAKKAAKNLDFKVFLGIEIKFINDPNEYLVYGLSSKFLGENPNLHHLNLKEFKFLIGNQKDDILIFQAHPFRSGMAPAADHLLDGLEVYNGNRRHDSHNGKADNYAEEHGRRKISGSDFHENEDLARGGIITEEKADKTSELLKILKDNSYSLIKS